MRHEIIGCGHFLKEKCLAQHFYTNDFKMYARSGMVLSNQVVYKALSFGEIILEGVLDGHLFDIERASYYQYSNPTIIVRQHDQGASSIIEAETNKAIKQMNDWKKSGLIQLAMVFFLFVYLISALASKPFCV